MANEARRAKEKQSRAMISVDAYLLASTNAKFIQFDWIELVKSTSIQFNLIEIEFQSINNEL